MPRVKRGTVVRRRHKKLLALASGYKLGRSKLFRLAKQAVIRAAEYAYRDRKVKSRVFRARFISKINAAVRMHDLTYSTFMAGLKKAEIELNRKALAELAEFHPAEFETIVKQVKQALAK